MHGRGVFSVADHCHRQQTMGALLVPFTQQNGDGEVGSCGRDSLGPEAFRKRAACRVDAHVRIRL